MRGTRGRWEGGGRKEGGRDEGGKEGGWERDKERTGDAVGLMKMGGGRLCGKTGTEEGVASGERKIKNRDNKKRGMERYRVERKETRSEEREEREKEEQERRSGLNENGRKMDV